MPDLENAKAPDSAKAGRCGKASTMEARRPNGGTHPATCRELPASAAPLALVLVLAGAPHAVAQSVILTGDTDPSAAGDIDSSTDLLVGGAGVGSMTVAGGAHVTSATSSVGDNTTGDGEVLVTGEDSSWETTGRLVVANSGRGRLRIEDRATVSNADGIVGSSNRGDVVVTGAGTTWDNAGQLTIGSYDAGTLLIENGAAVTSNQGYIGSGAGADGDVTVVGSGSSWVTTAYNISLGNYGTGALSIQDGGLVRAVAGVDLGYSAPDASGTLTLQGTAANLAVLETPGFLAGLGTASITLDGGLLRATRDNPVFFDNFGAQDITVGANGGVIDTDGHAIGVAPRFLGAGGLTKQGAGVLELGGDNAYLGATDIDAGALRINGDQTAATGLTTVSNGAILGGSGIVGGDVVVANGGAIAPGASPGTLTINGGLTLNDTSALTYELGQAGTPGGALNDLLVVHGDLTLDGVLNVTASAGGTFGPGVYRLIDYDGLLTDNRLNLGTLPGTGTNAVQTSVAYQVNLINTAPPSGGGGGGPGDADPPPPPPPPPPPTLDFWDGPGGAAGDGTITGGGGTWRVGGPSIWTEASGVTNGGFDNGVFAIFAAAPGVVTVDGGPGAVSVSGMQFASDGYRLNGDAITLEAGEAIVRVGDGASEGAAFTAAIASELTGPGQLAKTDQGTLVLTGANSFTGGTKVASGILQLGDGGTAGSIPGDVEVEGALAFDRSDAVTFDGTISGAGVVRQAGPGITRLTADSSAFTGHTEVQAGSLEVAGKLGGTLDVSAGGRLVGAGQVDATANRGMIAPGHAGFGTLTVAGDYAGLGGGLEIETRLGGDASPTDRLVVAGATSGVTPVTVINLGGPGAPTQKGIQVAQVGGASAGRFLLANGDYVIAGRPALAAGAYGYVLQQEPADGGWYLRSTLAGASGAGPLYQPGVPVYEAYADTLMTLSSLPTLRQRVGDRRRDAGLEGVWGRIEARTHHLEPRVSASGVRLTADSRTAQFGIDRELAAQGGSRLVGGLTGQLGTASTKLASAHGDGDIDTRSYGIGATLTWYGAGGAYIDGQAQATWFESDLSSDLVGREADDHHGHGYGLSLEAGKAVQLGASVSVTPQAQLSYASTGFGGFDDRFGAHVASDKGESLQGRLGLALDHERNWRDGAGQARGTRVYGLVDLRREFLDGTRVRVSGTPIDSRQDRIRGGLGAGGGYFWDDGRYSLHGEVSAETGLNHFADSYAVGGTAGFRMRF